MRIVSIIAVLFAYWLLMSGHYTAWLIGSGLVCALGVVYFARLTKADDEEGHPIEFLPRTITFWPWLAREIVKSAWEVTKIILNPKLPISPTLIRIKANQKTAVGITTYANSITLTPGTITARVINEDHEFIVHALTRDGAEGLAEGAMDRRIVRFEESL
ncbi:MAG: Na+/H+ antiporter subunit E [Hyphomicrobiales bacterium]|nr:Na+/H+ antiporter subunit E [Hyphomicrobiales bacterium]